MELGLKDRVAIVTGGSRGLGRQIAMALGREGCKVAICARSAEHVCRTVTEMENLGYSVLGKPADVMQPDDMRRFYDATVATFGCVDILVNNAGGARGTKAFETTTEQDWLDMLTLNLLAAVRMSWLVLPGMKRRCWGRIINISSIWGREYGGGSTYMASKAALIAFSKNLATEMAPYGVLVNSVAPGSIKFSGGAWDRFAQSNPPEVVQEFIKNQFPIGRFGWPEPVGELVAFLASDRADLLAGASITIDGGQSRSLI